MYFTEATNGDRNKRIWIKIINRVFLWGKLLIQHNKTNFRFYYIDLMQSSLHYLSLCILSSVPPSLPLSLPLSVLLSLPPFLPQFVIVFPEDIRPRKVLYIYHLTGVIAESLVSRNKRTIIQHCVLTITFQIMQTCT